MLHSLVSLSILALGSPHVPYQESVLTLAVSYLKDQDLEKAITEFLKALDKTPSKGVHQVSKEEQDLYEKGLKIYLEGTLNHSPKESALKLYQELKQTTDEHKDFYLLKLLMSTAYANLNRHEEFFNSFYQAYPYYLDHYLTYKMKAVLHIKLFEKAKAINDRNEEQKLVFTNIMQAIDSHPIDLSLYKIALLFAGKEHPDVVQDLLQRIIQKNIIVPRSDLSFFVKQALNSKQIETAQKFVDKSREWYLYSRSINEAQEHIDQSR